MSALLALPALHDQSALHTKRHFLPFTLFLSWDITSSEINAEMSTLTYPKPIAESHVTNTT
jgi:hypothetical protein